MINKVIDFLLNKIGYIIALTVGIFFKDIINKDYIIYIIGGALLLLIIVWFLKQCLTQKEISKTPLNNNSAHNLNLLLKKFCKSIKKMDKKLSGENDFHIYFPEFDFSTAKVSMKKEPLKVTADNKEQIIKKICTDIISLKRTLLEINKSEMRVKLGNFLIKHTQDDKQRAEAYTDFLGWTKILNDNEQGISDIKKGIEINEARWSTLKNKKKYNEANECIFDIVRGYRHLGTTYYTYKFSRTDVQKYINKAYEYLSKINNSVKVDTVTYTRLAVGIKYNEILLQYYDLIKGKISKDCLKDIIGEIEKLYKVMCLTNGKDDVKNEKLFNALNCESLNKDYIKLNDIDNHRKVKIYSLYAALSNNENSTRSIKKIESILNKNIYIDEAVELYIYNKINNI